MKTLQELRTEKATAVAAYKEGVAQVQADCPHNNIAHYSGFESYGTYHARRICKDCGYEEEGSWWSYSLPSIAGFADGSTRMHDGWSKRDFSSSQLVWREGRVILEVKEGEFFRYRP